MKNINENYVYKIVSKLNDNKAISQDISNNNLIISDKSSNNYQNWTFIYNEAFDAYKIVNIETNQILGYDTDDSTAIPFYPKDTESLYCHWIFEDIEKTFYLIKNAGDPDRVLDVLNSDVSNKNNIILFKNNKSNNQKFKLSKIRFKEGYSCEEVKKLNTVTLEENEYGTLEDLKYKIFSSEQFIKKWADFADMLGFAWCSGTNGESVGQDFNISKIEDRYIITANYRPTDPYSKGYRANERLNMEISNIRLAFDPNSINIGKQYIEKPEPILVASTSATNNTSKEASITKEIEYTVGSSTSNFTSNTISNGVNVESSFKVRVLGTKTEHTFSYNFSHEYSWGEQRDESVETKVKDIFTAEVPPNTTIPIQALLYKSKAKVPYTAIANLEYSITLTGFLKYEGNAYKNKPINRPTISYTFGDNVYSATEDIYDKYKHRNIPGYSEWDFNWSIFKEGCEDFNYFLRKVITPDGAKISGMFTNIDSSNVVIHAGNNTN